MIREDDLVNVSDINQFLYFLDCLSVATHQKTRKGLKLLIVDQCRCNDQGRNASENPEGIETSYRRPVPLQ